MFSFLKNLAIFGLFIATLNWLKERICKTKQTTAEEQSPPSQEADQA